MSKISDDFYFHAKLLGQSVGKKVESLHITSCMHPDDREIYAVLEWTKTILTDAEDSKAIQTVQQLIRELGFAHWQRDVVTDLALRDRLEEITEHVTKPDNNSSDSS